MFDACSPRNFQLGFDASVDGYTALQEPVPVPGPVAHVACGNTHTCVILTNASVMCFGHNLTGRLGDGVSEGPVATSRVLNLPPAKQVVGGMEHTCALLVDGNVRCWGQALALGYNITDDVPLLAPPLENVDLGGPVEKLFLRDLTTCALLLNHSLRCWGVDSTLPASAGCFPRHMILCGCAGPLQRMR